MSYLLTRLRSVELTYLLSYLLSSNDSVIEYYIFEEFDVGAVSFLPSNNLQKLFEAGLINDEVKYKILTLRNKFLELQKGDEWNINAVRSSSEWKQVLDLADEINSIVSPLTNGYNSSIILYYQG